MAYNNYFPSSYQQAYYNNVQTPYVQLQQQSNLVSQGNNIIWVTGEAGAKSYLVGAGQSVLLMDSESSSFYIKSTDASGMPLPLRVFDYTERTQAQQTVPQASEIDFGKFVTRDEFEELKESLNKRPASRKEVREDGE